jgi:hypothetical protein
MGRLFSGFVCYEDRNEVARWMVRKGAALKRAKWKE